MNAQAYRVIIEYKETISAEEVRTAIEQKMQTAVDRFIGVVFNVFGECQFGNVIAARLVFEHSFPLSPDALGDILNGCPEKIRIADLTVAE